MRRHQRSELRVRRPKRRPRALTRALVAGVAVVVALGLEQRAAAEPSVVIADTRDAPVLPALVTEVEGHVGTRATVHVLAARDADPLTFAPHASELVASGRANIVVWIAPVDGGYLVLASGGWPGRALIELVRIDASVGRSEIERTIALKVAGLLDTLLAPPVDLPKAIGVAPVIPTRPPMSPPAWRLSIEGGVARDSHQRAFDGRTGIAISRAWRSGDVAIASMLAGYWQPSGAIDSDHGRADLTELGGSFGLEGSWMSGQLEVFARPRFETAVLIAHGASPDGRSGEATVVAPYAALDVGVRRALSSAVWVGAVVGGELALVHNELVIDGQTIVDLGRARLHVGLSLTVAL